MRNSYSMYLFHTNIYCQFSYVNYSNFTGISEWSINFSFFTFSFVEFKPIISNSTPWRVVYLFYTIIYCQFSYVNFSNCIGISEWSTDFSFFTCHEEYEPIILYSTLWRVEYLFHSIHYLPQPNKLHVCASLVI